ncbi:MAG: hypothetical protein H0U02_13035 [Rubrobacter sp.]|nr:hypothetical protein [Rubrobacter sp.]
MVTVTMKKSYGATTLRAKVSAPTIERAVEIAGPGARVEFPIDTETFFAPVDNEGINYAAMTAEEVEEANEAGLPGAHAAYLDALKDDLGEEAFEGYALENCLI